MDALRAAIPLARLLLAIGEAGRECEVWIERRSRRARLSLSGGCAVALRGVEVEPLGDTLLALGALAQPSQLFAAWARAGADAWPRSRARDHVQSGGVRADARACAPFGERPSGRIGARLIAAGATSSEAVSEALSVQLLRGVGTLLRWPAAAVALTNRPRARSRARELSVDITSAVWSALCVIASELPARTLAELAGHEALVLTALGERRVSALCAAADRGELAAALRVAAGFRARSVPELAQAFTPTRIGSALGLALGPRPTPELQPLRAILRGLGAAVEHAGQPAGCALLLRKRRELARNVSATALLDLPEAASAAHARAALRRLASKLHPDRFCAADPRLRAVSAEVMGALTCAERALRSESSA